MKDKEKVQTTNIKNNGSENYSGKKSVLIRVRRFESFPAHHKIQENLYFIFYYAYKQKFAKRRKNEIFN